MHNPTDGQSFLQTLFRGPRAALPGSLCRLGLATRGSSGLTPEDVQHAVASGVNFLNWCGVADGLSAFIADLGARRGEVAVCVQFEARTASEAKSEFEHILKLLRTDYIDVLTFYYVEERAEWQEIIGPGGALEFCSAAQRDGRIRMLGVTSHQRPLAAEMAASGLLDMLMIRYNAAHRGAEQDIFPVTTERGLPVVVYTCLRWGALLRSTAGRSSRVRCASGPRMVSLRPAAFSRDGGPDGSRKPGGTRRGFAGAAMGRAFVRRGIYHSRCARSARAPPCGELSLNHNNAGFSSMYFFPIKSPSLRCRRQVR